MAALPRVTPQGYRRITAAALVALSVIIVTGAAVRLTGSGLGCTNWPSCTESQFVASAEYHAMIEFGNRVFTGFVSLAVMIAVAGSLRRVPYRRDLVWWSFGLVAGVIAQIIVGRFVVETHLVPGVVISHFLLSMVLVWNAVVLHHRAGLPTDAAGRGVEEPRPLPNPLVAVSRAWFVLAIAVICTGTIVTGSGPHGGDENAERLPILFSTAARLHAVTVLSFLALTLVLGWSLRARRAPRPAQRALGQTLGVLLAQATIGYVQYFTEVPALLVGFHIAGATLLWIAVVRYSLVAQVQLATRSAPAPAMASVPA